MSKLCNSCAEEVIENAAQELEKLEALTDEEQKVIQAMRDFMPARVELQHADRLVVWHRNIVR